MTLVAVVLFFVSFGLQLATVLLALFLIRSTGRKLAWVLVSLAAVLLAGLQLVSSAAVLTGSRAFVFPVPDLVALGASGLLFAGFLLIWRYVRSLRPAEAAGKTRPEAAAQEKEAGSGIAERTRSEETQREVNERLSAVLQASPAAIVTLDSDGIVTLWNRAAEQIFGWTKEEATGKFLPIMPEDEFGEFRGLRERVLRGESEFGRETRRFRKDGSHVYVSVSTAPLFDTNGDISGIISVITDITERKRLEDQLRHAQKMQAVGQLAGGVAHDFNNILTAIIGYGSLLQMKMDKDDPLAVHVEQILTSSERAANLAQQLLTFSRKQIIALKPVGLNGIVRRSEKLLSRVIGEDIEFRTYAAEDETTVLADSGQIEQVLMNLCTNARDAMPGGGLLTIRTGMARMSEEEVRARGYGKAGTYAVISVADSGTGMDEKTRERIFEPFFTTKEMGKGTGLGLAIVYGIVKQHNGYIDVESGPGKGTVFTIHLPFVKPVADESPPAEPVVVRGGAETILLAEDDTDMKDLIKDVLERFGYEVVDAKDGEDAVQRFMERRDAVKLLILDVVMPKKNAREVYETLSGIKPGIKCLFISGHTKETIRRKGVSEETVDLIYKPISPKELLLRVRRILDTDSGAEKISTPGS
ncbi:MAG: PAS domain S-box protein [Nitrospirae bacterium]|nr:PAS domain S-box protein [Nitrospirota bacterium]